MDSSKERGKVGASPGTLDQRVQ